MLPAFLITFREVIEAALIVATILGILTKLGQKKEIKTVWIATIFAAAISMLVVFLGSMTGVKVRELYAGKTEALIEGILMCISAVFITWAVFFLHNYFGRYKTKLLARLRQTIELRQQRGLFMLTFTAVLREGFEIILFLSTIYFSSNPVQILGGFAMGTTLALLVCFGLFAATIRLPIFYAFRATSALLILFAAGLLAHGTHELVEAGIFAATPHVYLPFLPEKSSFIGGTIQAIFGVTRKMEVQTLALYSTYTAVMTWRVFFRRVSKAQDRASGQDHESTY